MTKEEIDFTDPKMLREIAEKQLHEKQKKEASDLKEADINKLLHELQVHQIELEMQNEELQQAYNTMEIALEKYTMLFELSPLGYFSLDSDGTILELNFTAADMLGERRFGLINSNFNLFISKDSKPVFNEFFNRVFTSNAKASCEVVLGDDNKLTARVYMEGIVTGEEQKCLLSVVDISKFALKEKP